MKKFTILYTMKNWFIVLLLIGMWLYGGYESAYSQIGLLPGRETRDMTQKGWSVNKLRLLDPARFSMSQSYSAIYSSGFQSGIYGLYTNVVTYRIMDPLQVKFKIGYLMQPMAFQRGLRMSSSGQFLPGITVQYQPIKGVYLNFQIDQYPGFMYPYGYRSMYDHYPF